MGELGSKAMSPRARVLAIVSVAAVAAAGATVAGALLQERAGQVGGQVHGQEATATAGASELPALELAVVDRDDAEARALRTAERLYESGRADAARRRFEAVLRERPGSLEAAIGAAVAAWPEGTLERLGELVRANPESGVARLNLGLVLAALGDPAGARAHWREAERRDPDSPAALRAEDLRNPDSPPGRPQFIRAGGFPAALTRLPAERRIAELRRRARAGTAADWLLLGSAVAASGHRVSAQRAYDRAVQLAPASLPARVAAAVSRFDKDDPAAAFSRLGPLAMKHGRAPIVRFHLGLMLLWLPELDEARRQLGLARAAAPASFYGRQAARVLERIADVE